MVLSRLLLVASLFGLTRTMGAQRRLEITNNPSCESCMIRERLLATLGKPGDPAFASVVSIATVDHRGRYYLDEPRERGWILTYDPNGTFTSRMGKPGDGPGELSLVTALAVGRADTLHVFGARHSVYSPGGRFVRVDEAFNGARVNSAFVLPNGSIVAQAMVGSRDLVGFPFHVLRPDGTIARSFGASPTEPYRASWAADNRLIALAGADSFWSSDVNQYHLELWGIDGVLRSSLARQVPWFRPWDVSRELPNARTTLPLPRVRSIALDSLGRLWVAIQVPDHNWKPTAGPSEDFEAPAISPNEWERLTDTIIEIVEPATGRLIHSQRMPNSFVSFIGPGLIIDRSENAEGTISIRVWQLELVHLNKEKP
jgi:hypothetical protein